MGDAYDDSRWRRRLSRRTVLRGALAAATAAVIPFGAARSTASLRVGCILPSRVTTYAADRLRSSEAAGLSARRGAVYGEERLYERSGGMLELFLGTAADTRSGVRTAQRMMASDGVDVLIGGYSEEEAEALAEAASARGRLFMNVGATSDRLRHELVGPVIHVEPSASMYLTALADWFAGARGHRTWLAVHRDDREGWERLEACRQAAARSGITILHEVAIHPTEPVYDAVLAQLAALHPDGIASLLDWHGQLDLLGHLESRHPDVDVVALPDPVSQTRAFYGTSGLVAPRAGAGFRMSSWEATVTEAAGRSLSEDFARRWGAPMDAMAWANYAALTLVVEASLAAGTTEAAVLYDTLTARGATWEVGKDGGLPIDVRTGQLHQDVFVVQLNAGAPSFTNLSSLLAIAHVVGRLATPRDDAPSALP
jgi:ABC-type branched-subunit amino acid transport system substrate-binding protein